MSDESFFDFQQGQKHSYSLQSVQTGSGAGFALYSRDVREPFPGVKAANACSSPPVSIWLYVIYMLEWQMILYDKIPSAYGTKCKMNSTTQLSPLISSLFRQYISLCSLSYDRSVASSKTSSPQGAI
jgi:hypothetical protein